MANSISTPPLYTEDDLYNDEVDSSDLEEDREGFANASDEGLFTIIFALLVVYIFSFRGDNCIPLMH